MKLVFLAILVFVVRAAAAADVTGTWKGTAETPNGTIERTFVFKVSGDRLTGETTGDRTGTSRIMDGKIDGDDLSFSINIKVQDNEMKLQYKGHVSGTEMKLRVELPDGGTGFEYTAKKIS